MTCFHSFIYPGHGESRAKPGNTGDEVKWEYTLNGTSVHQSVPHTCTYPFKSRGNLEQPINLQACFWGLEETRELKGNHVNTRRTCETPH